MTTVVCVTWDGSGGASLASMSSDQVSSCTGVALQPYDPALGASPFALTITEGSQIGGAIFLLWASAWCIRQIPAVFSGGSSDE